MAKTAAQSSVSADWGSASSSVATKSMAAAPNSHGLAVVPAQDLIARIYKAYADILHYPNRINDRVVCASLIGRVDLLCAEEEKHIATMGNLGFSKRLFSIARRLTTLSIKSSTSTTVGEAYKLAAERIKAKAIEVQNRVQEIRQKEIANYKAARQAERDESRRRIARTKIQRELRKEYIGRLLGLHNGDISAVQAILIEEHPGWAHSEGYLWNLRREIEGEPRYGRSSFTRSSHRQALARLGT